jgi:hypothetical protein
VWIPVEFPDEQDRVGLAAGPGAGEVLPEAVLIDADEAHVQSLRNDL